ncbi:MAG: T9SS type A sorting domain-containing protein [Ignavibacteriae bacterium]|nr:T9SS type A sorting domain-containing protein [Ignavibacteriota bacterium]
MPILHSEDNSSKLVQLPIDSSTDYLCYYGSWNDEKIIRAKDFNLVILEPSNITTEQITELKKGHDKIYGTSDDVVVIGYLSIGEDHTNSVIGDGRGPCYYDWGTQSLVYTNKGVASWYLDDADKNGEPDQNSNWGSYYVNAGDTLWWNYIKSNPSGADNTLVIKNCDGLFLDTVDSASPWSPWPYRWMVSGMSNLIEWLRNQYPEKYLIVNRGLFYFDPEIPSAYSHNIRPYIDGIMFESYFIEGDRAYWADKLNTEGSKPDGFKIIALDYFDSSESTKIQQQLNETAAYNWASYITRRELDQIRYDVFHKHTNDLNPPTWNSGIGLANAIAGNQKVELQWGIASDQTLPINYNVYYTKNSEFNFNNSVKISNVNTVFNQEQNYHSFSVENLENYQDYYFLLRAVDNIGNEDQNFKIIKATPPNLSTSSITIDGNFSDWNNISKLDTNSNPIENILDIDFPNADIEDLWATVDEENFYLSYKILGEWSNYFYHIFIDIDDNENTGYRYQDSSLTGAEYMIENETLWKYTGQGGSAWSWSAALGMIKKNNPNQLELSIPLNLIDPENVKNNIRILLQNNESVEPYSLLDISPNNFASEYFKFDLSGITKIEKQFSEIPKLIQLFQNYPNPFNSSTQITFSIPQNGNVELRLFNNLGELVKVIEKGFFAKGIYSKFLNSENLTSGVYFCKLDFENNSISKKIIHLK